MKTVYLLKGLPASGKSTWAREKIQNNKGSYKRINKDDLRDMLDDGHWTGHNEKFVLNLRDHIIIEALKDGKHVIVDDTNLHPKHKKRIEQLLSEHKDEIGQVKVRERFFEIDLEEAIKRDLNRPNSVGPQVIKDMYNRYIREEPEYIEQDDSLPKAIICDIDGTVARMTGRSPYEWDRVHEDEPIEEVVSILEKFKDTHEIIMVTGRDGGCYDLTKEWLEENDIPFDQLYSRPEGDKRKDSRIKEEIYRENIEVDYYIEFVLDDRNQTVEKWRDLGLRTLQVDNGNF